MLQPSLGRDDVPSWHDKAAALGGAGRYRCLVGRQFRSASILPGRDLKAWPVPWMVALDCMTVWRFGDRCTGKRPLYLASAWPTAQALVLTPDAIETLPTLKA